MIEGIDQDLEGDVELAAAIDNDPGRDLGLRRHPGRRFFFSPDEVEPLCGDDGPRRRRDRILVAGIGNVFLGDDGFGVTLADRLAAPLAGREASRSSTTASAAWTSPTRCRDGWDTGGDPARHDAAPPGAGDGCSVLDPNLDGGFEP